MSTAALLRTALTRSLRTAAAPPRVARFLHASTSARVSAPPFAEPTSINPTAVRHAETTKSLHTYGGYLMQCLPKFVQQFSVWKDELTLYVAPSALVQTMQFLRDHAQCQFKSLVDISGADYPTRDKRFEIVYHLVSIRYATRIRVKTYADEVDPVPTIVPLFNGANWYEREAYDMYGMYFSGHPDLRRILTDYGFDGHPLRKDFPLTGYTEVRYDEEKKRVVYEPLQLTQAFRNFDAASPWEVCHNSDRVAQFCLLTGLTGGRRGCPSTKAGNFLGTKTCG
ncbi:NADH-ubiquinone oxidoreductase kDa subunit [Auriculariales sp. MPI-PUGE-AT-0066]|nr:NADH-ubiquinone oxidoreductase kDa subunit [Auriculariales sp. MPI-PUGE-AT-0066]